MLVVQPLRHTEYKRLIAASFPHYGALLQWYSLQKRTEILLFVYV